LLAVSACSSTVRLTIWCRQWPVSVGSFACPGRVLAAMFAVHIVHQSMPRHSSCATPMPLSSNPVTVA
jgi:hypothetical protein